MATKYADRAIISLNGATLADLQSATLSQNHNRRVVHSMTNDGRNRGFVEGNLDIDIKLSIAVRNKLSRPKLEAIDYENNDVQIAWFCGAEEFTSTGVFLKDNEDNASGIGDEVKASFNFGALDLKDAVGNSSLFDIQLG